MKNRLDRALRLNTESPYESLYSWAINEIDADGKIVCADQIPWFWPLYFVATEIVLTDENSVEREYEIGDVKLGGADISQRRYIRAKLRPGDPLNASNLLSIPKFSMFGTNRPIRAFTLSIHSLKHDGERESCVAWGALASSDSDFDVDSFETEDCVGFTLQVKAADFDRYAARISSGTVNEIILQVGGVHGFYSAWSPSIETNHVKVLTRDKEHGFEIPKGFAIDPPRLRDVGKAELYVNTKCVFTDQLAKVQKSEVFDDKVQRASAMRPEPPIERLGFDPDALKLLRSIKTTAHWIVGLILVLVLATILR